jgi:hypothetical protein
MIKTKSLRCFIGALGMALPIIVVVLSLIYGYGFPDSISATYFVPTCITPFMIILGSAGILLVCYKGYNTVDNVLNTAAGFAAWGVCLFPCAAQSGRIGTFQISAGISDTIHMVSALVFFGILAYNSFFLFTKGAGEMTKKKKIRNIIYRVCGVGMLASFLIMLLPYFRIQVWLTEAVALFFFAISFLTKADIYPWLACDTPYKDSE